MIFSAGSVFLPALYVLRARLGAVPSTIVLAFAALLFAGGLILFSVPALMLYKMAQKQQANALDALAPVIEDNVSRLAEADKQTTASIVKIHYTLSAALQVRAVRPLRTPPRSLAPWHAPPRPSSSPSSSP